MSYNNDHDPIITRAQSGCTKTYFTTNYAPPICEASREGIPCWHHAEIPYQSGEWKGHWVGGETVWLCKQCYDLMWEMAFDLLEIRALTCLQEQELSA